MSQPATAAAAPPPSWQQPPAAGYPPHQPYPSQTSQQWQGQAGHSYDYSNYYGYYQNYPQGSYDPAAYNQYYAQQAGQNARYYPQPSAQPAAQPPSAEATAQADEAAAPPPPPGEEPPPPPPGEEAPPEPSTSAPAAPAAPAPSTVTPAAPAAPMSAQASADAYQQYYNQYYSQQGYSYPQQAPGYNYSQYPGYSYPQAPASTQQPPASYYQPPPNPQTYSYPQPPSYQPPAPEPPKPQTQPPWKTAPAATAAPTSYNAAPPPATYSRPAAPSKFSIKPNQPLVKPPASAPPTAPPKPAYTAVPSTTPTPAAAPAAAAQPLDPMHHKPLLDYVSRCLRICKTDRESATMKAKLTAAIKQAKDDGRIYLIDWDTHPMPSLAESPRHRGSPDAHSRDDEGDEGYGRRGSRPSRWSQESPRGKKRKGRRSSSPSPDRAGGKKQQIPGLQVVSAEQRQRQAQRAERFGGGDLRQLLTRQRMLAAEEEEEEIDYSSYIIKGTKQELEKSYFRLTSAPLPHEVRPEGVLRRALERLVGMIARGEASWLYYLDQFKGMRQDITVQHLRSEITVQVYEAHGRASLEYGDVAEFNQCQTQLTSLYADGVAGCRAEFTAYHMLYQAVHAKQGQNRALLTTWKNTPPEVLDTPEVCHALQVRQAVFTGDYRAFFRLYAAAPKLGRALMDVLVPKLRHFALSALVKAFKPSLPMSFVVRQLGFRQPEGGGREGAAAGQQPLPGCKGLSLVGKFAPAGDDAAALADCVQWAQRHGAVVQDVGGAAAALDCKASAGKLFVPEDTSKVAHGDSNLAIEDFLARAMV